MVLNNKDLKIALNSAREYCPNKEVGEMLSRDNVMLTDILHGSNGIIKILKISLPLMETWDDEIGKDVQDTFKKYIKLADTKIN